MLNYLKSEVPVFTELKGEVKYSYCEVLGAYDLSSKYTGVALLFLGVFIFSWAVIFSMSRGHVGSYRLEIYALLCILLISCVSLVCSTSLLVTFLSIEAISFCSYILTAGKLTLRGAQGGWLYAVSGGLASLSMIFGITLLISVIGSASYGVFGYYAFYVFSSGSFFDSTSFTVGILLVLFSFLFKLAAAPYHSWVPDVYAAAPLGVVALFATVVKFSVFVAFFRLIVFCLYPVFNELCRPLLLIAGIASLLIGSIGGLAQSQIKRLLAYSSIAHMGFVLVGLAQLRVGGLLPSVVYVLVYVTTSLGVFAILTSMNRCLAFKGPFVYITDLSGIRDRYPFHAFCFVILLFSLLGLPPFAGFFAKYGILLATLSGPNNNVLLALMLVLSASISAVYYLRLVQLIVFSSERMPSSQLPEQSRSEYESIQGTFASISLRVSDASAQSYISSLYRLTVIATLYIYVVPTVFFSLMQEGDDLSYFFFVKIAIAGSQLSLIAVYYTVLMLSPSLLTLTAADYRRVLFVYQRRIALLFSVLIFTVTTIVAAAGLFFVFVYPISMAVVTRTFLF